MVAPKVTNQMIAEACDQLCREHKKLTYEAIRQRVGQQGSMTTIRNGRRAWEQQKAERTACAPLAPEDEREIVAFAQTLMDKLMKRQRAEMDRVVQNAEQMVRKAEEKEEELASLCDHIQLELEKERVARLTVEELLNTEKSKNEEMRVKHAGAASVIAQYERDLAVATERNAQLQTDIGALSVKLELVRSEGEREIGAAGLLRAQIADATAELRVAQGERDEARNALQSLQRELVTKEVRGDRANRAARTRKGKQGTLGMESPADPQTGPDVTAPHADYPVQPPLLPA